MKRSEVTNDKMIQNDKMIVIKKVKFSNGSLKYTKIFGVYIYQNVKMFYEKHQFFL